MKIHLISDVHLEFYTKPDEFLLSLVQPADVLVVAGDLAVGRKNVRLALRMLAYKYEHVIYVPGNHEYYHGLGINDFNVPEFAGKLPKNVHFLNPGYTVINGVRFVGAALWTDFQNDPIAELDAKQYITDFRKTTITTEDMKYTNFYHKQFIKEHIHGDTIVVTHFLPAMACISPRFRERDMVTASLNKYFANSMDDWIHSSDVKYWLFGHTHDQVDVTLGSTRLLANPCGYPGECPKREPLIIEL